MTNLERLIIERNEEEIKYLNEVIKKAFKDIKELRKQSREILDR